MIFSSELKRNKKRIFGAKSGYPSRILVRRAEFRSSDIRKCNSDSLSVSFCLSSYRARFIIKFMASSGNRTLYVPIGSAIASTFLALARGGCRRKVAPFRPTGPIHAHQIVQRAGELVIPITRRFRSRSVQENLLRLVLVSPISTRLRSLPI